REPLGPPALPARGSGGGGAQPRPRRAHLPGRRGPRRPLHRHAAAPGRNAGGSAAARSGAAAGRGPAHRPGDRRGTRGGPRQRADPPRYQAVQHLSGEWWSGEWGSRESSAPPTAEPPSTVDHSPLTTHHSPNTTKVTILDFGLARAVGGDAHLTQSGVVIGTPAYMAPEQARGEALDPRSDLFSLGCVLYRACTGRLPFPGRNALATLLALAQDRPPPPRKWNRQLPAGLSELIMKLLATRPQDRYPDAGAVVAALDEVAGGNAPLLRRRGRAAGALAVVAVLCACALAAWSLVGDSSRRREAPTKSEASLFLPATHFGAGTYPWTVAVADFDGDGKADLAV